MDLGISNRKFAAVIFLLLTIIISLALSGLTFLINDKRASLPEGFDSYNLEKTNLSEAANVNEIIGKAGGPVSKTANSPAALGAPVKMNASPAYSVDSIVGLSTEAQYGSYSKPIPVIMADSNSQKSASPSPAPAPVKTQDSIFNRIFDFFGNGSNKPEAFSLKY
jgi:hypothetical protein